jgi:hypothetical protein
MMGYTNIAIIPALGRLRLEAEKFKDSLDYIVRSYHTYTKKAMSITMYSV